MIPADIDPWVSLGWSDSSDTRGVFFKITSLGSVFPSSLSTVSLLAWDSQRTSKFKFLVKERFLDSKQELGSGFLKNVSNLDFDVYEVFISTVFSFLI